MSIELGANSTLLLQIGDSSPSQAAGQIMTLETPGTVEARHPDPGYGCVDWYQYETGAQTESAAELC